jgi:multidrug transporter EmrE-like cation transporter
MGWLFLIGAIIAEVSGALSLRMASSGKRRLMGDENVTELGKIC